MKYLLYTALSITVALFLHDFLIPYTKNKIMLWQSIRRIKKMKSKYTDKEVLEVLDEVIIALKKASKNEKITEDED